MNQDLEKLLRDITDPKSRDNAKALFDLVVGTSQKAEDVRKGILAVRRAFVDVVGESREFTQSFASSLQEITKFNIGLTETRKAQRRLVSLSQKLQDYTAGYTKLSVSELKTLKEKAIQERERLKDSVEFLKNQYGLSDIADQSLSRAADVLLAFGDINEEEASAMKQYAEGYENINNFAKSIRLATEDQQELNRITGLTGAVLSNLNRIGVRALGGLGINLGALEEDFKEAQDAVEDAANEMRRIDPKAAESWGNKFKVFRAALPGIGKAATRALVDPLVTSVFSIDALVSAFKEVNKASVNFQRLTGQTDTLNASLNKRLATSVQYLEQAAHLTEVTGLNANNIFDQDVIASAARLQTYMGLSAEQSGRLAVLAQVGNKNVDSTVDSIVGQVSAFNRSNKAAVSQGVVLRDIAGTTDDILVSLGNQPGVIAKAAAAARRLGLSLNELDSVASSFLDFESSISSELEAQLITGRNINLTKARELALANDLEGLGQELFSNSASILEFSSQNRIQQEAQAKALGLTRQQLAKIAVQRGLLVGITSEELEKAAGVTAEDLKRTEAMEQLKIALQKVAQALVGPVEMISSILNNATALRFIMGAMVGTSLAKMFNVLTKIAPLFKTIYRFARLTTIANAVSAAFKNPAYFAVGLAGAAAVGGALAATLPMINDGVVDPDGGLVVSGPKGSVQTNPSDYLYASTNPPGTGNKVEQLLERLVKISEKGGNVYLDGNEVGKNLALGASKL